MITNTATAAHDAYTYCRNNTYYGT